MSSDRVIVVGSDRQIALPTVRWVAALALIGLSAPGRRGWWYFSRGPGRLDAATAKLFADDLELCLGGLPDEDAVEDQNVFPRVLHGGGKAALREVLAVAWAGAFGWKWSA